MKTAKQNVHFTDNYLLQPANPVLVNLIGCGGTGSQVLTCLSRMNQSLLALNHPGLMVRVFDDDVVTSANLGRQLFAQAETGMNKAVALVTRINRFFGTNWKAVPHRYEGKTAQSVAANITISCVDTAATRFEIAGLLKARAGEDERVDRPIYWLDYGNRRDTGQVVLATVGKLKQPASKRYRPVPVLPFITDEFSVLLHDADTDNMPSCSLADALSKQDLFINSALANMGASLLWQLFREGMVFNRGFFLNLKTFQSQPLKIG